MNNKLSRRVPVEAEDQVGLALEGSRDGTELSAESREKVLAQFLLRIRHEVPRRPALRETLAASVPPTEMKEDVLRELEDLSYPGAEGILSEAVDIILQELEHQRKEGASKYIVDGSTGRALMPVRPNSVFTPAPYVDENGVTHKPSPILHPGISSGLALAAQEAKRKAFLVEKAKDPRHKLALSHILDPNVITSVAAERLADVGINRVQDCEGMPVEVEFGTEIIDAEIQSLNPAFHRTAAYAAVLATRVRKLVGVSGVFSFGPVRTVKDSKRRWYAVEVKYRTVEA